MPAAPASTQTYLLYINGTNVPCTFLWREAGWKY